MTMSVPSERMPALAASDTNHVENMVKIGKTYRGTKRQRDLQMLTIFEPLLCTYNSSTVEQPATHCKSKVHN